MSKKSKRTNISTSKNSNMLRKWGLPGAIIIVLLLTAGVIVLKGVQNQPQQNAQAQQASPSGIVDYPSQGQTHIPVGQSHPPYNSNPPTSGWHYDTPADWGIYDEVLPDETAIHNLEHGGIWISYRDSNDQQTVQALKTIAGGFTDHVILTYRPTDDSLIAVAAWGHLLKLDRVDTNAILNFINLYINQGPEKV